MHGMHAQMQIDACAHEIEKPGNIQKKDTFAESRVRVEYHSVLSCLNKDQFSEMTDTRPSSRCTSHET